MKEYAVNPHLGCGVGLRSPHYPVITSEWPRVDWFEAVSENYMDTGGRPLHILDEIRHRYPVALHGTALSIGSTDPLNLDYLKRLKRLIERIDPFIVSDHLCWSGVKGDTLHDLLPLPLTEEALNHVIERVQRVQEFLGRQILLENVSTYVTFRGSAMPEWEFFAEVARRSDCRLLVDLNNIYVNAANHGFDPHVYIQNLPPEQVGQIHLAGHTDMGSFLFDTHSATVIDPVWKLYEEALGLWGPCSTLIEWDENIPPFKELAEEAERAKRIYRKFERHGSPAPSVKTIERKTDSSRGPISVSLDEAEETLRKLIHPSERESFLLAAGRGNLLNPQGGVTGEERTEVYAKGYLARIRESLAEVYEAVHQVTGEEAFERLTRDYALSNPSRDYNLNFSGRSFPIFLESTREAKERPFLIDLARLEWLVWEAFHAFDGLPFDPQTLSEISLEEWEKAQIIFQPSVRLFLSSYSVLGLWLQRHTSFDDSPAQALPLPCPERILIGRKGDQVRCEVLDENQYRLLRGLLEGKNLGLVCEELAEVTEENNLPITAWFSRWVQDGLVARLQFALFSSDDDRIPTKRPEKRKIFKEEIVESLKQGK